MGFFEKTNSPDYTGSSSKPEKGDHASGMVEESVKSSSPKLGEGDHASGTVEESAIRAYYRAEATPRQHLGVEGSVSDVLTLTKKVFQRDGWLKTRLCMENRPQQTRMAEAVAKAFTEGSSLLFEAGTGVGKSLAYLIPGIIYAKLSKKKFVVSTNTIPLQEQILHKDLEVCRQLFSDVPELRPFADFKVVLMLGKANYLCGTRLSAALRRHDGYLPLSSKSYGPEPAGFGSVPCKERGDLRGKGPASWERGESLGFFVDEELRRIRDWWADGNCTGLREHLPFRVSDETWDMVNADSRACSRKKCTPQTCAYRRARAEFEAADLVVVNHSLLFSFIDAGVTPKGETPGILYANDFVVLDESHQVPDIATNYFGVEANSHGVQRLFAQIAKACRKKGVLAPYAKSRELDTLIAQAMEAADDFFNQVRFSFLDGKQTVRFREPNWLQNSCEVPFGNLENRLKIISDEEIDDTAKAEITDFWEKIQDYRLMLRECLELKRAPEYAYWAEVGSGAKHTITVSGAPIDVAKQLAETLFSRGTSAVLSSATLADGNGSMARFCARCGTDLAEEPIDTGREKSPFDYDKNMEIFVAKDCPDVGVSKSRSHEGEALDASLSSFPKLGKGDRRPATVEESVKSSSPKLGEGDRASGTVEESDCISEEGGDGTAIAYNADVVEHCAKMMPDGGILVLCTSFDFCSKLAKTLRQRFGNSREIFVQGEGEPRSRIIKRFKSSGNAILIGNHSFWMGIDVPGPALSQVVIPRLPFANPSLPIVSARMEWINSHGGNAFKDMSLPDAVLQFRQGIGRLIRKASDCGRLILTDSRLMNKSYGKTFLDSLPHQKYVVFTRDNFREIIGH